MTNRYDDKRYMQICSERTLQTNQQGFFLSFADEIADSVGQQWIKNVFGKLKTDRDRIKCIYQNDKIKDAVIEVFGNVQQVHRGKCGKTSAKCRIEAETIFRSGGDKRRALALYSRSALKAPGDELALSLFGRSEVLMSLGKNREALSDLQQSLKKLPDVLKIEALTRSAICYGVLGEDEKAEISIKIIGKLLNDPDKLEALKNKLKHLMTSITPGDVAQAKELPKISDINDSNRHPIFKNASKKIGVAESKELGRFVVANENIKTGETLVVENPFAACLLPEKFGTHCHHCFERLVSPIGCPDCSGVAFCTPKCRDEAISTYHKFECKFLDLLIGSGMSILSHTALRMVTQTKLKKTLKISRSEEGLKIRNLCTNSHKREPNDFLQRTLMAGFLLRCLQKGGYFGGNGENVVPISEDEYEIGETLLFNLQMLQFNAHEIYETLYPDRGHRFKGARPAYIGVAVYPTVALFNHDCYPGVTRYFAGKRIVIKALRPLRRGDPIGENYGPIFTWRNVAERQRSLSARYWFDCKCPACVEDWPGMKAGLDSIPGRVRCPTAKCRHLFAPEQSEDRKCPSCKKRVSLEGNAARLKRCEGQYDLGIAALMQGRGEEVREARRVLCDALDDFHEVSAPPHAPTHLAQETLRMCLADAGNTHECPVKSTDE